VFFLIKIGPEDLSPSTMLWALESCEYKIINKKLFVSVYCL